MKLYILLLLLYSTAFADNTKVERYIIEIDAHEDDCYSENVNINNVFYLHFEVTDGGFLDIDFQFVFPNGTKETRQRITQHSIMYNVTEKEESFFFCFSNKFSTLTPKTIHFSLIVMQLKTYIMLSEEDRMATRNQTAANLVYQLLMEMEKFDVSNYALLANKEHHYDVNENTNSRIVHWALFEALMLVVLTTGQVYYIKKFFEIRRFV